MEKAEENTATLSLWSCGATIDSYVQAHGCNRRRSPIVDHYRQSLVIEAGPAIVYVALPTINGLRGWWTDSCDGVPQAGGHLNFHFGRSDKRDAD